MPTMHVSRVDAGGYRENSLPIVNGSSIQSYQNLTAAGVFTDALVFDEVFVVWCDVNAFISMGIAPNAATDPKKLFVPANTYVTVSGSEGHKIAWALA